MIESQVKDEITNWANHLVHPSHLGKPLQLSLPTDADADFYLLPGSHHCPLCCIMAALCTLPPQIFPHPSGPQARPINLPSALVLCSALQSWINSALDWHSVEVNKGLFNQT